MSVPTRAGRRSTLVLLLVPAAVGVAGALLALRLHFQPPTVPPYAIAGASDELLLRPGERFELEIRPASPVTGAVGARGFLLRANAVRPWEAPVEVARDGSVRIAGPVETLFANVPPGPWDIVIAVGRPETLPTAPQDILRKAGADGDAADAAWRLVRRAIRLGS